MTLELTITDMAGGNQPFAGTAVYQASITDASKAIATSQVALPKDTCSTVYGQAGYEQSVSNLSRVSLQSDNIFGDDSAAHQLGTVTGDVSSGYTVALAVPVDTRTTPTGGGAPGGPRGGR
jgi:hypothetical protein